MILATPLPRLPRWLTALERLSSATCFPARSRDQLAAWMLANKTGDKRLRAGLPKDWRVGDKTGSGGNAETNDIAVIWPPGRGPMVVTVYYAGCFLRPTMRASLVARGGQGGWQRQRRERAAPSRTKTRRSADRSFQGWPPSRNNSFRRIACTPRLPLTTCATQKSTQTEIRDIVSSSAFRRHDETAHLAISVAHRRLKRSLQIDLALSVLAELGEIIKGG